MCVCARVRSCPFPFSAHARRKFAKTGNKRIWHFFARRVVVKTPQIRAQGRTGGRVGVCTSENLACAQYQNLVSLPFACDDGSGPRATRKTNSGGPGELQRPSRPFFFFFQTWHKEIEGGGEGDLERLCIHADPGGPR